MKKLFTSVMAALCLAASVGTLSAQQTQLTEAQKEAFKKEVLPVVFEQIKEQAGIDILGWANPQLSNTFAGIPVLESSSLRATTTDPMTVHPDSVVLSTSVLANMLGNYGSIISGLFPNDIKITFENYTQTTLPISYGTHPITVELPSTINVGNLIYVIFNSNTESDKMLDLDIDLSLLGSSMDLVACSIAPDLTGAINVDVDIQDGLRDLIASIPAVDYRITLGGLTTGSISATLYSVAEGSVTNTTPMGSAEVALDLSESAMFPVSKIEVTGYDVAGTVDSLSTFNFDMERTTTAGNVLTKLYVNKFARPTVNADDSTFINRTIIIARDFTPAILPLTPSAAIQSVLNDVVYQLANEGEAVWYDLSIAQTTDSTATAGEELLYITVSPYTAGTNAIADVDIKVNDSTTYTVRATADLTSQVISVDVMNGETTYGTAYFTSNAAGIITANEDIAEEASAIRIIPTDNGVRVLNVDRAEYQIVSMTGSTVARGVVSGDETISTANLPKGIYVIAVDQNGDREVVKFVR